MITLNQKRPIHVFAREDTPVADRSNPIKFLEIASSLDDSLLATTSWSKGRSKPPSEALWAEDAEQSGAGFDNVKP